jgi:hypothetical protein
MKQNQRIILICVAAAVLVVGVLLWFNRYSFSEMRIGDNTFPVRTSRFTGESEVFVMGSWTQMGGDASTSSSTDKTFVFGPDELRKIDGRAGIRKQEFVPVGEVPKTLLSCSVYNGTSHSLGELTVRLELKETDTQKGVTRDYRLRPKSGGFVPPLSNGDFETDIGLAAPDQGKWSWAVVGATGLR